MDDETFPPTVASTLTLFFWQVSQRDQALHSDRTQSTGWASACWPAARACRTEGSSSSLAAVLPTALWWGDDDDEDGIKTMNTQWVVCSIELLVVRRDLTWVERHCSLSHQHPAIFYTCFLRHSRMQGSACNYDLKKSNKHKKTALLPQQQEVQRQVQQAAVHTVHNHSCPHAGEHASAVLGLTGDNSVTRLSSLCKQRLINTRQDMDSALPLRPGAEYATPQSTAGTYCVLFSCLLSCWYDTQLLFIMKDIYIWRQGKQFIYLFTLRSHPSGAAERPCDDVNSRKFADRLVFVCTDVNHVCVLPTFELCLPSFGTSQGDTIGWITWISGTISK